MWQYTVFVLLIGWGSSDLCLNTDILAEAIGSLSQGNLSDALPENQFVNQNPIFAF